MTTTGRSLLAAGSGLTVVLALVLACADGRRAWNVAVTAPPAATDRPIERAGRNYVRSDACRACHPREYDTWSDTFHRTMTQEVTPETVLADFDDVELEFYGRRFVLERRGDEFWVEVEDITYDGPGVRPRVWRQIVLATGSHHFQSFWYPEGEGRKLDFLGVCWRVDEARWMPVHAAFLIPPDYDLGYRGRWNTGCHVCHTVGGEPRLDGPNGMDTHVSEFGIACEACHGRGEEHVLANRNPLRRYGLHEGNEPDPTIVDPRDLPADRGSQVCGQCHAFTNLKTEELKQEWRESGFTYDAGDDLTESRAFLFEGDSFFWKDGMVRLAGREFTQFLRTPCFVDAPPEEQMSCFSCHRMHQDPADPRPMEVWRADMLEVGMDTNRGCTQCHAEYADTKALEEHTHHASDSTGSSCYNCHMPYTSWSLLGACRSHQVDEPGVQATVQAGRPNACNLCHLDRTLAWSSKHLKDWWGVPRPKLDDDQRDFAAGVLWALEGDAAQRALAAWHMGWEPAREASGTDWMVPLLAQLLEDPYEAVRFTAGRSLRGLPGFADFEHDFLADESRRAAANAAVRSAWEAQERSGEKRAELLLTSEGELQRETFQRLLLERDDTPVILSE